MAKRSEFEMLELHSFANPRRVEVNAPIVGESMTRQEFADECDINQIMARYEEKGIWPIQMGIAEPRYVDYTQLPDTLAGTLEFLRNAEGAFMQLPATVRREFDNDPVRFVEFASDVQNGPKLREWGLAEPEKVPDAPMKVEVVNQPKPASKPADKPE